ncbi:LD-carboxypeptidase [Kluyvera ascorbata]|nr:LD-carboxypeptidase [Kluyvera ascorbata]
MQFLCDPEVKAVMPPWGGDLAIEILERIDFERLKAVEPKWFSGFSDLTTLHLPLTTLSGWATAHGPNLMELGARVLDETTGCIWAVLESERGSTVTQYSSAQYQVEENQWGAETDTGFNLTQKTVWKRLDGKSERLTFTGRLIGGCLDIIGRIAGTQFGSIEPFKQQSAGDGVILYFENVEMGPCELTRALYSLRLQGWFSGINGIMIGRSAGPNADSDNQQNYLDALQSALGDINIPVLYDVDIGHIPPQMTLVNGAMATVTFSDSGGSVVQELWW